MNLLNVLGAAGGRSAFPSDRSLHIESYSFGATQTGSVRGLHDAVALNPQPIPPGREPVSLGGRLLPASLSDLVALNPQPLPPKEGPHVGIGGSGGFGGAHASFDGDWCGTKVPGRFPPPPPPPLDMLGGLLR